MFNLLGGIVQPIFMADGFVLPEFAIIKNTVMEPVRGGQLASLTEAAEARLKAARQDEGIPAWAFRFLQSFPNVTMTLSGMSNMEQLLEYQDL